MRDELENWRAQLGDYVLSIGYISGLNAIAACTVLGDLHVFNCTTGAMIHQYKIFADGAIAAAFSPSGTEMLVTRQDGVVTLINTINFSILLNDNTYKSWIEKLVWSPNGHYVALAAGRSVKVYNSAGAMVFQSTSHSATIEALCWHRDSSQLVTGYFGGISVFDVDKQKLLQQMPWPTAIVSLSWGVDGKFICGGTQNSKIHFWPMPYQPESDFEMSGYKGKVTLPVWSHDAALLATNCWNELIVWKVAGVAPMGQEPLILAGHEGRITSISFSPNSHLLLTGSNKGEAILWDTTFSRKMIALFQYDSEITNVYWLPDATAFIVGTKRGELCYIESPA